MNPVTIAEVAAQAGIPVELISTLIVLVAPRLVSPLAAVWKRWRGTTGPDTRTVIKVLTALIVGLGGFLLGLYGYDLRGSLNGVMAALLTYLKTTGDYERDVNVRVKADRVGSVATTEEAASGTTTEQPASRADLEAEILRQTGEWPMVPGLDDLRARP